MEGAAEEDEGVLGQEAKLAPEDRWIAAGEAPVVADDLGDGITHAGIVYTTGRAYFAFDLSTAGASFFSFGSTVIFTALLG